MENDKPWKETTSLNSPNVPHPPPPMSSQTPELNYQLTSDFNKTNAKLYSPTIHSGPQQSMVQISPNQLMNMQPQSNQSSHHSPMSPAMHSPRLRLYNDTYNQPPPSPATNIAPHNTMRPATMVNQASFSTNSPNLNTSHPVSSNSECFQTPQANQCSQPTEISHTYGQNSSYGVTRTPFSPNTMHPTNMHSNTDPYVSQQGIDNSPNMDVYKVGFTFKILDWFLLIIHF